MKLYEIDQAIMDCLDEETGEIIDLDKLNSLMVEREKKIEGVALWYKNLAAEEEMCKKEKKAFEEREKRANAKKESLKKWITGALEGQKFSTAKCAITFRNSEQVLMMDDATIPKEFQRIKTSVEPDKDAIKAALKNGQIIPGFALQQNLNATIK